MSNMNIMKRELLRLIVICASKGNRKGRKQFPQPSGWMAPGILQSGGGEPLCRWQWQEIKRIEYTILTYIKYLEERLSWCCRFWFLATKGENVINGGVMSDIVLVNGRRCQKFIITFSYIHRTGGSLSSTSTHHSLTPSQCLCSHNNNISVEWKFDYNLYLFPIRNRRQNLILIYFIK